MANHILGRRPANIFCKLNQIAGKTTAKSVDAHVAGDGCLPFPYHSLTNPLPFAYQIEEKGVSGAIWQLLVFPYHSLTILLLIQYLRLLT